MFGVEIRFRDKTGEANYISTTLIRRTIENECPISTTTPVHYFYLFLCRIKAKRVSLVANLRTYN